MIISASLFSCKTNIEDYISKLKYNQIQVLHIDYIENTTPSTSLYDQRLLQYKMALDIHMICSNITKEDILYFNSIKAKYLCYQYENLQEKNFDNLFLFEGKKGIAFTINTKYDEIENVIKKHNLDFVLIMCTIPGISGQVFNYDNINRIKRLKENYPYIDIHVDGGIDNHLCPLMHKLNVSLIVSGSYLANAKDNELMERICALKYEKSDICASDLMLPIEFIQTVNLSSSFIEIVNALNESKTSTVIVQEKNNEFMGIITDGDVRRSIIAHTKDVFNLTAENLLTRQPYIITPDCKVSSLLYDLMIIDKTLSAIPVVEDGITQGIVDTRKLI